MVMMIECAASGHCVLVQYEGCGSSILINHCSMVARAFFLRILQARFAPAT
jgi:hypothetical protein